MTQQRAELIEDTERALLALDPLKRRLLDALRVPGSASSLAKAFGLPRQQLGYHLRALEQAGLVRLVQERPRRGFTERVLVAVAGEFVLDPALLGTDRSVETQDKHAAAHLVQVASGIVREVTRMRSAAEAAGQRLLTFTIEADVAFKRPQDFDDFSAGLAQAVAALVKRYAPGSKRRGYHLVIGAHPAAAGKNKKTIH